ncbi:endo alpha-1,4 polygalactosaminidase [Chlorella sorokiniana]|uniref:Endo alpha-1,4 polygalactosaminidase n=1 Tax=Chlorella sorokiniana TaxID=3076 RepID=A0A2P6TPB1_CHLSO|nr:endo alpha-1,4 polygalactosaminidase [Chlorella sorokiniana]|eukprot:PRW51171.1 endo alpha-1,4 polygalactosaminidase [Chlorella sorokiniana]
MRRPLRAPLGALPAAGILAQLLLQLLALGPAPAAAATVSWWKPPRRNADGSFLRWQYQLSADTAADIKYIPGVQVYAIDIDLAKDAIAALKKKDRKIRVVCYFSAGSWEDYRVDDDQAKRGIKPTDWGASLGKAMDGWPGERWVDVRKAAVRTIMAKRIKYCADIKCDGIDPDNINGHENPTGFNLKKADLVDYNKFLAGKAHARGLAIGLKNGLDMIPQLASLYDFAINEECFTYSECSAYSGYFANKPVVVIEYCNGVDLGATTQKPACFCPRLAAGGLNGLFKRSDLKAAGISCTEFCKRNTCGSSTVTSSCASAKGNICSLLPSTPLL